MSQCPCPPRRLMNSRQLVANWYSFFSKGHQWSKGHQGKKQIWNWDLPFACTLWQPHSRGHCRTIGAFVKLGWILHHRWIIGGFGYGYCIRTIHHTSGLWMNHFSVTGSCILPSPAESGMDPAESEASKMGLKRWHGGIFFHFFWFENHINHY